MNEYWRRWIYNINKILRCEARIDHLNYLIENSISGEEYKGEKRLLEYRIENQKRKAVINWYKAKSMPN